MRAWRPDHEQLGDEIETRFSDSYARELGICEPPMADVLGPDMRDA